MTNFVFRGNWVADNKSNAVWIDVSSTNSTIVGNQVLRSACYGIYIEQGNGIIIAGNVVNGNTDGIGVHFTQNAYVYNNTVINNGLNVDLSAWEVQTNDLKNVKFVNNLVWNASTSLMVIFYRAAGCNSATYSEVDFNGYYRPSGSAAKNVVNWCNDYFATLSAFHSKTGYEDHGLEIEWRIGSILRRGLYGELPPPLRQQSHQRRTAAPHQRRVGPGLEGRCHRQHGRNSELAQITLERPAPGPAQRPRLCTRQAGAHHIRCVPCPTTTSGACLCRTAGHDRPLRRCPPPRRAHRPTD